MTKNPPTPIVPRKPKVRPHRLIYTVDGGKIITVQRQALRRRREEKQSRRERDADTVS